MRTRKEIRNGIRYLEYAQHPHHLEADILDSILEVLIDIRDIQKEVHMRDFPDKQRTGEHRAVDDKTSAS